MVLHQKTCFWWFGWRWNLLFGGILGSGAGGELDPDNRPPPLPPPSPSRSRVATHLTGCSSCFSVAISDRCLRGAIARRGHVGGGGRRLVHEKVRIGGVRGGIWKFRPTGNITTSTNKHNRGLNANGTYICIDNAQLVIKDRAKKSLTKKLCGGKIL